MGKAVHTISPTEQEGTGPAGLRRDRRRPSYDERRERLEAWIERAIERLDRFDARDEDREPQADDEPCLGWPTSEPGAIEENQVASTLRFSAYEDDLELDDCDSEDGGDAEPDDDDLDDGEDFDSLLHRGKRPPPGGDGAPLWAAEIGWGTTGGIRPLTREADHAA